MPALKESPPAVVLVAHNGLKFDFPILFVEMLRCGIGLEPCERWYFVDTLHLFRAVDADLTGGCVKLQCLLTRLRASDGGLQAHRALDCRRNLSLPLDCPLPNSGNVFHQQDDCFALRGVTQHLAASLGVSVFAVLFPHCVSLDKDATLVALSCML